MAGGRHDQGGRGTPRGELARLRADREGLAGETRGRIELAMLEACGEDGYRAVSVQSVIDRCGGNRAQFYRHYKARRLLRGGLRRPGRPRLVEAILGDGRGASGWRAGLRAALGRLAALVTERPALARGLLVEVHVAGGAALARRASCSSGSAERARQRPSRARGRRGPAASHIAVHAGRRRLGGGERTRARPPGRTPGNGARACPDDRRRLLRRGGGRAEQGVLTATD